MHRVCVWLCLIALLEGTNALADVRDSSAAGFTVENTVTVPADPMSVWRALVNDVDAWWPRDHTWWGAESTLSIEPRTGGCFCETAGDRQAAHMQVAFVEPGKLLRLLGGLGPLQGMGVHGVMEWRLEPLDAGTRITLYYRAGGYTPDNLGELAPVVDQVQAQQLRGLAERSRAR